MSKRSLPDRYAQIRLGALALALAIAVAFAEVIALGEAARGLPAGAT